VRTLSAVRFALVVVALLVLLAPGAARADGDPASDVLYLQDVYLPYERPSAEAAADLQAAIQDANKAGYRTKVALIASFEDLGVVSSLYGKPQVYARFLGAEIRSFFTGHLLVVMPQGFGAWFNRFDVTPQKTLLARVRIESGDSEGLAKAAAAAVRLLAAEDHSKPRIDDRSPPDVQALPATVKRGSVAHLRYVVSDNSGKSREEVRVYGAKLSLLAVIKDPLERADGRVDEVGWKTLHFPKPQHFRFCVVGIDGAGNQSKASCARFDVL
jgi:hypothetical protein